MRIDETLEPEQARQLIASNEVTVLDVRADDDWHDKRVPGARHVSEAELDAALDQIEQEQAVVIVCDDGEQSAGLAARVRESGREAACIDGGMKAWEREKFPLQPSADADDDVKI
jgi:rhodanese-related sulfurtransferase